MTRAPPDAAVRDRSAEMADLVGAVNDPENRTQKAEAIAFEDRTIIAIV